MSIMAAVLTLRFLAMPAELSQSHARPRSAIKHAHSPDGIDAVREALSEAGVKALLRDHPTFRVEVSRVDQSWAVRVVRLPEMPGGDVTVFVSDGWKKEVFLGF